MRIGITVFGAYGISAVSFGMQDIKLDVHFRKAEFPDFHSWKFGISGFSFRLQNESGFSFLENSEFPDFHFRLFCCIAGPRFRFGFSGFSENQNSDFPDFRFWKKTDFLDFPGPPPYRELRKSASGIY